MKIDHGTGAPAGEAHRQRLLERCCSAIVSNYDCDSFVSQKATERVNTEHRVLCTHPTSVALPGAVVHAEDADVLALPVQTHLREGEASLSKSRV